MVSRLHILFYCVILTLSPSALATSVLKIDSENQTISIDQDTESPFVVEEPLCVYHGDTPIACGKVVSSAKSGAVVKLGPAEEEFNLGDEVGPPPEDTKAEEQAAIKKTEAAATITQSAPVEAKDAPAEPANDASTRTPKDPEEVDPAQEGDENKGDRDFTKMSRLEIVQYHRDLIHEQLHLEAETRTDYSKLARYDNISIGTQVFGEVAGNSIWPTFQFSHAVSNDWAIGFQASYYGFDFGGVTCIGPGLNMTFTYNPVGPFDGVTLQTGAGISYMNYTVDANSDKSNAFAWGAFANVGWRFLLGKVFNLGVFGGAQYVQVLNLQNVGLPNTTSTLSVLIPTLYLDLGFAF
jgi:hypothetical protein